MYYFVFKKLKNILLSIISFLFTEQITAQSFSLLTNNESYAYNDFSSHQFDVFSFSGNPSSLINENHVSYGIFTERKFMLKELSISKFSFSANTSKGTFGSTVSHAGDGEFSQNEIAFYYARKLSNIVGFGIGFDYLNNKQYTYHSVRAVGSSIGMNAKFTPQLQAGISFHNPAKLFISNNQSISLEYKYEFGIGYDASAQFYLHIHTIKVENCPAEIICGFQYLPSKKFYCKVGIQSQSKSMYIGAGCKIM